MSISPLVSSTEEGQIFENFIAGEWRSSTSGETFKSTNPANTQEIVGRFQKSTLDDLNAAVAAAKQAQPAWAAIPAPQRGEILLRTALILQERQEELATLMTRDGGYST